MSELIEFIRESLRLCSTKQCMLGHVDFGCSKVRSSTLGLFPNRSLEVSNESDAPSVNMNEGVVQTKPLFYPGGRDRNGG